MQRQLCEFTVRFASDEASARYEPEVGRGIEHRHQQRNPQNSERDHANQYRQPAPVNAMMVDHRRHWKLCRFHAGVMHASDSDAHGDRRPSRINAIRAAS